jgi:hypothetical protein
MDEVGVVLGSPSRGTNGVHDGEAEHISVEADCWQLGRTWEKRRGRRHEWCAEGASLRFPFPTDHADFVGLVARHSSGCGTVHSAR